MQNIPYISELLEKEKENELPKELFDIFGESIKMNYKEYKDGIAKTNKPNEIIKQLIGTAVPPPKPIQFDLIYQQLNYPNLLYLHRRRPRGKRYLQGLRRGLPLSGRRVQRVYSIKQRRYFYGIFSDSI